MLTGTLTFVFGLIPMSIIRLLFSSSSKFVNVLGILFTSIMVIVCYYMAISGAALMKLEGIFIFI